MFRRNKDKDGININEPFHFSLNMSTLFTHVVITDIPHSEEEIHGDLEEEDFWATVDLISDIVADMAVSIIFIFFTLRIFALINIMANNFFPMERVCIYSR
jgi:hypothetical protein